MLKPGKAYFLTHPEDFREDSLIISVSENPFKGPGRWETLKKQEAFLVLERGDVGSQMLYRVLFSNGNIGWIRDYQHTLESKLSEVEC